MTVVFAALAAVWGWFVLNDPNAPRFIVWIGDTLRKLPKGEKLVGCPWCIGAWLSIIGVIAQGDYHPVHWLAAAGLTGLLASLLPDDGEPTE